LTKDSIITRRVVRELESAGHEVALERTRQPDHCLAHIDARAWDGLVLFGCEPLHEHALRRSLRHATTPVLVSLECDEGVLDGSPLRGSFSDEPLPPDIEHQAHLRAALERCLHDERTHFHFSTAWHRRALLERFGLGARHARSTVGLEFEIQPPTPLVPVLLQPGPCSVLRSDGADLFVRTALELLELDPSAEFAVVEDPTNDPLVLSPLSVSRVRMVKRETLASHQARPALALVTARDGSALALALECLKAGILPLVPNHPALRDVVPSIVYAVDDPNVLADRIKGLRLPEKHQSLLQTAQGQLRKARDASPLAFLEKRSGRTRRPTLSKSSVLTIAVPAFNSGEQLTRCVHSLSSHEEQGAIEIVIVDDGSTDETGTIADRLSHQLSSVRVIHQANQGHGGAINTALHAARGRWFRVVDADDWVDSNALRKLVTHLKQETVDLVLTEYTEDRPSLALAQPMRLLARLPPGAVCRFSTMTHPLYGLTSWGPLLSTSTFRTSVLREAKLSLTPKAAYVDMEYCTFGLEFVETVRHLPLDLYRYSLGSAGQSVSPASYRKRYKEHEAMIFRLCEFARDNKNVSQAKRDYILQRVIRPLAQAHLNVLRQLLQDKDQERSFRQRLNELVDLQLPTDNMLATFAKSSLRAALPAPLVQSLGQKKKGDAKSLARELGLYVLPSVLSRYFARR
jgi:glycosyltransferase involved in cell wall biosynthesis